MYNPPAFRETRLDVLHALIRQHPLGLLISGGAGGLMANPIPFLVQPEVGEHGRLLAHMARANDQLQVLREGGEILVVFQGAQAFVTPSWYVSKSEHGKVVPTWNYVTVQVRGRATVVDDAGWLRDHVGAMTASREAGRAEPWAVEDAPEDYIAAQLRGIAGVEVEITAIEGKWKISQNRNAADREGVVAGLRRDGDEVMAALVEAGSR